MDVKIVALITVPMLSFIAWVTKHMTNSQKHPCKKDIVFKDVCEVKQDCIENEIKNVNNRLAELKTDMKEGFQEIKVLVMSHH